MSYYPNYNLIQEYTRIQRERFLPDNLRGKLRVQLDQQVGALDIVAQGWRPSDYKIIDVADALGLEPDDPQLDDILKLKPGREVQKGEPLGEPTRKIPKRRIPLAPADGIVSVVDHGRIILQIDPEPVEVRAGLSGKVIEVFPEQGVIIETFGTLIQCAWGNGQFNAGPYDFEPGFETNRKSDLKGLADLLNLDVSLSPYRGKTIILVRPLTQIDLEVITVQELGGIVAPSAPPKLREAALELEVPVILTEGFGDLPPTSRLYDLLYERRTSQAIFNAVQPDHRNNLRPEIIIPQGGREVPATRVDLPLQKGMRVRLRRAPYAGRVGQVVDLPDQPTLLENGLRAICAKVKLQNGEQVLVPRANLESLGDTLSEQNKSG